GSPAPSVAPHSPHAHRLSHALQRLHAAVLEPHPRRGARQRAHGVRDQYFACCREPADPRGDVDGAAVDVVAPVRIFFARDVAGVEAEVKWKAGFVAGAAAGEGGFDRLAGARKDGKDAVAEELAFDGGAGVLVDDGAEGGVEVASLRAEGGVAEALSEGGGVGD